MELFPRGPGPATHLSVLLATEPTEPRNDQSGGLQGKRGQHKSKVSAWRLVRGYQHSDQTRFHN